MTNRRAAALLFAGTLLLAGVVAPVGATPDDAPDAPISINHTYVGGETASDHAYHVTVTVAPTQDSGPVNDTVLTVSAGERAFIATESVATSQTTGGNQVITRQADQPTTFHLSRIEPGETASVSFRVYPKAVLPSGETLARIELETQFVRTQRVVSETHRVAPTLGADGAAFATDPPVPPLVSGGVGAAIGGVVIAVGAVLSRRRRDRSLRQLLRSAKQQTVNAEAERELETALRHVGGESDDGTARESGGEVDADGQSPTNGDDDLGGLSVDLEN